MHESSKEPTALDNVWFRRRMAGADATVVELVGWVGREHPDGTVVDSSSEVGARWLGTATADAASGRVRSVRVADEFAPHAAGLWYVAHLEPHAKPPAVTLVAFETPQLPDGAVVDSNEFTGMPVRSADQVAAVRWVRDTGQVHQVYVAPTQRRRGIGTKLLIGAGLYAVASGWPRLWGGGERTELGEALVTQGPEVLRRRSKPRRLVLPPMTPRSQARGETTGPP